jgi:dihydroneopterin aldolase
MIIGIHSNEHLVPTKCTFNIDFLYECINKCSVHDSLSRSPYTRVIFKFWETVAKKDYKIANTIVMFEDTLNEDICTEGWFLLAF